MISSDEKILLKIKDLVVLERKITAELLEKLFVVEQKALYAELGYSSMFNYLCKELGHSEAAAMRRISTLRLMKKFPEVTKKIEEGKLSLSSLAKAEQTFKKSELSFEAKENVLKRIEGLGSRETDKVLLESTGSPDVAKKEKVRRVSGTQHSVNFILSDEEIGLVEELRAKMNRSRKLEMKEIFLGLVVEKLSNLKGREEKCLRKASPTAEVALKRRSPGTALKREVLMRAKHLCEHPGCTEKSLLEIHHLKPWAQGGETSLSNLVALCKGHHKRETYLQFGLFK
jgi:hypothetical protein